MRFCFIVEEKYAKEPMPLVLADQLKQWGHAVDVLEPQVTVTHLTDLFRQRYDAYILKTFTNGPGLSILEAAEAVGIPTINSSHSIRLVRDKAVAAAFARAHDLPVPRTYFVTHQGLLQQIPAEEYPLVVKPSNGSYCRDIYRLNSPADIANVDFGANNTNFLLAQHYVENTGFDIKLYVIGQEVHAAVKKSPLHPAIQEGLIPVTPELKKLAQSVGKLFKLDIYGLDVVETPQGFVVLDINDFPSFNMIPRAVATISEYILHIAKHAEMRSTSRVERMQRRPTSEKKKA